MSILNAGCRVSGFDFYGPMSNANRAHFLRCFNFVVKSDEAEILIFSEVDMRQEMEIVLIEDNDADARRIMQFLRANVSNPIRLFQDGGEAARFLLLETDTIPKLILLDLVLPSVDGLELFNMIRSEPKERNLSVIFLISSPKTKEYLESIGVHADGYLKKPTAQDNPVRIP
jgi:two-component system, response regulator